MADKKYALDFEMSDGTIHSVEFTVPQGEKGDKGDKGDTGANGKDGANGTNGKDGYTPIKGTDYFTPDDISDMVNEVTIALPKYNGEVVDV